MNENLIGEKKYEQVYGNTFELYDKKTMLEFMEPYAVRFKRNHLNPSEIFKGKKCFDAGCGNGRGSLFMLLNGAKHVTAFDYSSKNIKTTKAFAEEFNFSNIDVLQGSLENIPFDDESYDFVWCNGVIMHTAHPDRTISEISRILKPGGKCWLYIYGAGGVYWRIIYKFRKIMKDIDIDKCIATLKVYRYSTRYVAEYIDDWFASFLRTYTHNDVSEKLESLGFDSPELLKYGMDYDTSHRLNVFKSESERKLMGEGDLRYFLTKSHKGETSAFQLAENETGSDYAWDDAYFSPLDNLLNKIEKISKDREWLKIAICAHIQRDLRILLNETEVFKLEQIMQVIEEIITNAQKI